MNVLSIAYHLQTVTMAEQSVDIVVIRPNAVQETLSKEIVEEKIAQIKEEKMREKEAKEAKEKENMEVELS